MHAVETQRYVITDGDGDETYCTQVHDIVRGDGMIGPNFTEAESEIIAFALNAVAEGHTLYWGHAPNEILTAYDGPTEGVRP